MSGTNTGINTIDDVPAASSPQSTDEVLTWQTNQVPHTRKMTLAQVVSIGLAGGAPPVGLAGGDLSLTYPNPRVSKILGLTPAPSATTDTTNASNITSGTLPAARLPATGVASGSYTNSNVTVDTAGRITAIANGSGGGAGGSPTGIAGGDLTGFYPNPTLAATGATAGSYTLANITIDAKGRILTASSGTASGGVTSFNARTGVVTLTSTDVTTALTYTPYNATNPAGYQTAAQVTTSLSPYALTTSVPVGSSTTPLMDGTAAAGSGTKWSKDDHIHPTDTSRYAASNPAGFQNAAQVSASISAAAYTLPTASTSVLGGVKVDGTTVTIAAGVISASGGAAGVASFNTRTGAVTLISADVTTALGFTPYNATNPSGYQTAAQVTTTLGPYALTSAVPVGSSTAPLMDGVAAAGTGTKWSKDDHVHPVDTSRYAATNPSGYQTAAQVTTALLPYAPIKDAVFTGTTTLAADPALDLQASTKKYVDTSIATVASAGITTLSYNVIANTAAADPGVGNLRFNTTQQYDATQLYIDSRSIDNTDWTLFIKAQATGAKIVIQLKTDSTKVCRFLTTGAVTDNTGWLTIPVTFSGAGGYMGMPFAGGNNVVVAFLGTTNNQFLPLGGGTLTGDLFLPSTTPTVDTQATTKKYVDDKAAVETYTLPTASTTVLGGVKVDGSTITIASGVITAVGGGGGGGPPTGTAGGDLSSTYPNPTVSKINGTPLGTMTATAGNTLIMDGTTAQSKAISGDATLASGGALTVTKTSGVAFAASATTDATNATNITSGTLPAARLPTTTVSANSYTNANITVDAAGRLTAASNGTTYTLPTASTTVLGGVKIDGTTITIAAGVISAAGSGVTTFNTRSGAVTLTSADVTTALTFTPYNATNPSGYQTAANVVTAIAAGNPGAFSTLSASSTVSGAGFTTYLASPPAIGGTAAAAGSFTTLAASSTVSGAGFTTYLASPPAIGGTAASTGKFTTLAATTSITSGTTGGASLTGTLIQATGNTNSFSQIGVQNISTGTSASTDIVATADNGSDTTNYVNLGINSSTNTDAAFTVAGANDGYAYGVGGHFLIGAITAAKTVIFFTGGSLAANKRATITDTGINSAAIGATTPSTGAFTTLSASSTVSGAGFTTLLANYALTSAVPVGSSATPIMDGTATAGSGTKWSKDDHVHPTDTSRYAANNPNGYQTGTDIFNTFQSPPSIGTGTAAAGRFTNLIALTSITGAGFDAYMASPPAIGGTAANTGKFTTLTASSTVSGAGFTTLLSPYALTSAIPAPSSTTPLVDTGAGAVGVGTTFARADHVHPAGGAQPYTVGVYVPGVLTASQVVVTHQVGIAVTFPAAFGATATGGSSRCGSLINATASTTLTVAKCLAANDPTNTANFSAIGTLTFSAGGHAATLATTGGTTQALAAGDFLQVTGPSSADASLANVFITLIADR